MDKELNEFQQQYIDYCNEKNLLLNERILSELKDVLFQECMAVNDDVYMISGWNVVNAYIYYHQYISKEDYPSLKTADDREQFMDKFVLELNKNGMDPYEYLW